MTGAGRSRATWTKPIMGELAAASESIEPVRRMKASLSNETERDLEAGAGIEPAISPGNSRLHRVARQPRKSCAGGPCPTYPLPIGGSGTLQEAYSRAILTWQYDGFSGKPPLKLVLEAILDGVCDDILFRHGQSRN